MHPKLQTLSDMLQWSNCSFQKKKKKRKKRGEGDQEHVRVEMLLTIDPVLLHSIVKYILRLRKDTDINTIKYNLNYHSGYIILSAC